VVEAEGELEAAAGPAALAGQEAAVPAYGILVCPEAAGRAQARVGPVAEVGPGAGVAVVVRVELVVESGVAVAGRVWAEALEGEGALERGQGAARLSRLENG